MRAELTHVVRALFRSSAALLGLFVGVTALGVVLLATVANAASQAVSGLVLLAGWGGLARAIHRVGRQGKTSSELASKDPDPHAGTQDGGPSG